MSAVTLCIDSGVTIEVGEKQTSEPLFLLDTYSSDPDALTPGDRFSLSLTIVNEGDTEARDVTLTFGGAQPRRSDTETDATPSAQSTPSSGSSTSSSTTFAPTGSGATHLIGNVEASGGTIDLTQDFIVNGTVNSGIYDLPITLRYVGSEGTTVQETLTANLLVLRPPRLRIALEEPIAGPDYPVGEITTVSLTVINIGRTDVALTIGALETENANVISGAESFIGTLRPGEDRTIDADIMADEEGEVTLNYTLTYIDDFDQEQTITRSYTADAVVVERPPDDFAIPDEFAPPVMEEPERDWISRLVLAFMGLGS